MITEPIFYTNELVYLTGSIFCLYDFEKLVRSYYVVFDKLVLFHVKQFCY